MKKRDILCVAFSLAIFLFRLRNRRGCRPDCIGKTKHCLQATIQPPSAIFRVLRANKP